VGSRAAAGDGLLAGPSQAAPPPRRKRRSLRVSDKTVERFVRRQARIVGRTQPAVFPNARVTGRKPFASCSRSNVGQRRPRWNCAFFIALNETSRSNSRQFTLRFCGSPDDYMNQISVRRARSSRKLRVAGGWKMSCEVDEDAISLWNQTGAAYQPNVSEPTPYKRVRAVRNLGPPRNDLLPPPSGRPDARPPGPLSLTQSFGSVSRNAQGAQKDIFKGCTAWERWGQNPNYWIYGCFWNPRPLPGLLPGYLGSTSFYELYYYVGNDAYGRPMGRFFYAGYAPFALL
jgi:hypothetical protein